MTNADFDRITKIIHTVIDTVVLPQLQQEVKGLVSYEVSRTISDVVGGEMRLMIREAVRHQVQVDVRVYDPTDQKQSQEDGQ